MGIYVISTIWLLWIGLQWTLVDKCLSPCFSVLWGIYLGAELMVQVITLSLAFKGTAKLFSWSCSWGLWSWWQVYTVEIRMRTDTRKWSEGEDTGPQEQSRSPSEWSAMDRACISNILKCGLWTSTGFMWALIGPVASQGLAQKYLLVLL